MMMELVRVVKRRKASHDLGWTATDLGRHGDDDGVGPAPRVGLGSHASSIEATRVLIGGIDARGPSAADAAPT